MEGAPGSSGSPQRGAQGGGLRGPRSWPRLGAGAPGTASSQRTDSSRAHAGLCGASVQELASRGSATDRGPRSALPSRAQMDPGCGLRPRPRWRARRSGWGSDGRICLRWAAGAGVGQGRGRPLKGKRRLSAPRAGKTGQSGWRGGVRRRPGGERPAGSGRGESVGGGAPSRRMRAAPASSPAPPWGFLGVVSSHTPHAAPPDAPCLRAPGFVVPPACVPSKTKSRCGFQMRW